MSPDVQMAPTEDFAAAMRRLTAQAGTDATFLLPGASGTYASGTQFDPETDMPFDPTLEPTGAGAPIEVVKRVGTFFGTVSPDTVDSPIGIVEATDGMVIVNIEDWPDVEEATHVVIHDDRYKITLWRTDGFNEPHRVLGTLEQG